MGRRSAIDFIDTCSAAYRREVFVTSGGFDATFPTPSVEDQEFSYRLARQGYPLRFVPGVMGEHQHDCTPAEYVRRKFWIAYWNTQLQLQYPEKGLGDSQTPLTQRLQLGLLALAALGAAAACAGLFLASAIPLAWQVAKCDPPVLAVLPLMLLLRAAPLGAGLVAGAACSTRRRRPGPSWPAGLFKRAIDIAGGAAGLALAWPLLAAAAVWIRLDSPGPALFAQTRVGQYGRHFQMYKLHTMACGGISSGLPGGAAVKKPGDPRVTRAGRWLRRWSLDELPQLVNVLRGDMSLIGPRPEEPQIVAGYTAAQRRRLAVRPGLTGPMQVNGRADLELEARVQLELDYIEHYSLARDLSLLLHTLPAVISGRGAY